MQGARSVPQRPEGWVPQAALHAAHRQLAATIGRARGLEATHLANVLAHDRPRLQCCAADLKQAMDVCGGTVAPCMHGCMVFVAGYIHYLLDELSTAASYVREAIKSLPETPPEWLFLAAQILVPLGDGQEAEFLLRAAIKGRPRYLAAHLELMTLLSDAGDLAGCYAVAKAAATLDPPLHWTDGWQRPDHMVPSLCAFPWHDPATIDWCSTLEAQATFIKEELMSVWPQTSDKPTTSGWTDVGHGQDELSDSRLVAPLVDDRPASWREFVLLGGPGFEAQEAAAARQCPRTVTILRSIPAVASLADAGLGEAIFSTLAPGTWLRPHCGGTNARLTCHLGLVVPPQCTMMRVGSTWREWEEGRCLVFDDSFEHEVRHTGGVTAGQRVVLLLRFWHPDLPPGSWASTLRHAETQVAQQLIARLPEPTLEVRSSSIADGQFDDVDSDSSGVD